MGLQPIRFQDAGFDRRFALCRSRHEGCSIRWVPFGMPRLNKNFDQMVFFLYGEDHDTGKMSETPEGTGFFVGVTHERTKTIEHAYAVTCAHVIPHGHIIRVNSPGGSAVPIDIQPDEWEHAQRHVDLVAVDVTDRIPSGTVCCPIERFASKQVIDRVELGPGEDGFMLGMFADHPGEGRNLIVAKHGNVAMLARDDAPIEHPKGVHRPAHLFDLRSRGGFSGSPVFVYRTPGGDLREVTDGKRRKTSPPPRVTGMEGTIRGGVTRYFYDQDTHELDADNNLLLVLLGVHAAQYPEVVEAKRISPKGKIIGPPEKWSIPGGTTIVIPAWEIVDLLNKPVFIKAREGRERKDGANNRPIPESARKSKDDANPDHKEDFTALLNVAARKPKPAG